MQPTPSPQMGRLQINNNGSMAPPPAAVPKSAAGSSTSHRSASKPSPGIDFLDDMLQLNNQQLMGGRKKPAVAPPSSSRRPLAPRSTGMPVHALPMDWALKRNCLVTSSSSLAWCTQPLPSVRSAALRGPWTVPPGGASGFEIDEATESDSVSAASGSLGVALERALLTWRHPAQRLPPMVAKQLINATVGSVEKEYAESLNNSWDAALRGLWIALRDGRCPYFYCRSEAAREATAATSGHFCLLWRNTAAIDEDGSARAPPPPPPPLGWAVTDAASCYAVLSPSSHGLRTMLDKAGVPYEMPLAPAGTRVSGAAAAANGRGGGGGSKGGGRGGLGADDEDGEDDETLAYLNRGRQEEQPDSTSGRQRRLAGVDHQASSTLVFRGRSDLHALHEFLINNRTAAAPYFLSLQLLAPQPFLHGAACAPRVVHQAGRLRDDAAEQLATAGGGGGSREESAREETVRLEDAERGGPALLLPGVVRRLTELLRHTQPSGFDVIVQPDAGAAASEALNLRPLHLPVLPRDIGRNVAPRPQPNARMWIPADPADEDDEMADARGGEPPASAAVAGGPDLAPTRGPETRPRSTFTHVRCHQGELSILA